jgi:hypothetical protein
MGLPGGAFGDLTPGALRDARMDRSGHNQAWIPDCDSPQSPAKSLDRTDGTTRSFCSPTAIHAFGPPTEPEL